MYIYIYICVSVFCWVCVCVCARGLAVFGFEKLVFLLSPGTLMNAALVLELFEMSGLEAKRPWGMWAVLS